MHRCFLARRRKNRTEWTGTKRGTAPVCDGRAEGGSVLSAELSQSGGTDLNGKCEGVEVLSELKQLHTLSLWLSAPVSWDDVSLPGLRVLHLRGEKNGDITPLLSSITYLHLEEMRKTEDLAPFLTPAPRLQKLYLQSLPAVQKLPALDGLPSLYALKLYELHKLSDLSALSRSHLRCFAASLIADKLSAKALADAVMAIPDLEAAALQLADRSERRYGGIQKAFVAAGKSALLREEISALTTWLSL